MQGETDYAIAYAILIITISASVLWLLFRKGRLVSIEGGLHLQVLIFFGVGALAFALAPDHSRVFGNEDVAPLIADSLVYFLVGYIIAVVLTWSTLVSRQYGNRRILWQPSPKELTVLAAFGLGGGVISASLEGTALASIGTYFSMLYYPTFYAALLVLLSPLAGFSSQKRSSIVLALMIIIAAVAVAVISTWRSVLIVLLVSTCIAIIQYRRSWVPWVVILAIGFSSFVLPFQIEKRANYEAFVENPANFAISTFSIPISQRIALVNSFLSVRISYARELVYVDQAIRAGYPIWNGETYTAIFWQMIPRVLWPGKPEIAKRSGYDLPREIGLLSVNDEYTSWSVNLFAEDAYNFGTESLIWFVSIVFILANPLERYTMRFFHSRTSHELLNISLFYFFLTVVSAIFMVSSLIGLVLVLKLYELVCRTKPNRSRTP